MRANRNSKNRKNRKCVVSGNAPSLKEIDYSRLPLVYDVFRCNQFYFEDKYYLGKNIKAVTFATQMFFEQIYTMLHLKQKGEYNIESLFIPCLHRTPTNERDSEMELLAKIFDNNIFIHNYSSKYYKKIKAFLEFIKLQEIYFYKHPTSSISLCGIATALGYKEIYLAGIDFYEGKTYAFDSLKDNILTLMPEMKYEIAQEDLEKPKDKLTYHSKRADLEALWFLSKHYDIKFYSLCPNSPMSNYFPLAPITNNNFKPVEKPKESIKDILIPPEYARCNFNPEKPKENRRNRIKNNIYFRIFSDFLRLPSDILYYFKTKKG